MDKTNLKKNNLLIKQLNYFFYRRKHLVFYIIIGIFSIFIENLVRNFLLSLGIIFFISSLISLLIGISIAFSLNFFLNFNVPKYFFYRSIIYFFIISTFSFLIQALTNLYFNLFFLSYDTSRFIYSGVFFIIAYFLHINISFKQKRKVGVAIYLTDRKNIDDIFNKIGPYPDFIHIDILDSNSSEKEKNLSKQIIKELYNVWPNHKLDLHIMSKNPSNYITEYNQNIDVIYFHYEISEDIDIVINSILNIKAKPGIVLHAINDYDNLEQIVEKFNYVLVLSIDKVGVSGQVFIKKAEDLIEKLNNLKIRNNFELCVDGGITIENINKINCEKIVSASNILNSSNPKRKIMGLQTLSRYERNQFKN